VVATLLRWQIVTGTRLYKLEALWLGSLTFLKKIEASRKQIKSAHSYCTITYINKIRIKRSFLCMGLPSNTTIDNLPSEAEIDTGLRGSPFLSQLGRDIPSLLRRQNITGTVFEIEKIWIKIIRNMVCLPDALIYNLASKTIIHSRLRSTAFLSQFRCDEASLLRWQVFA
jgi:hypothetical protein